jgi:type II secretory pathway pseudopilin PulG
MGLTLVEMVIAVVIITIVFAAIVPQFRAIFNSWDSKAASAETLQNGRVLIDHFNSNLSKAVQITAVSDSNETDGYIEFQDNDGNILRYDVDDDNYVEFGLVGSLYELAGPVSQLQFTCYDACDLDIPLDISTADVNDIRFVKVETTLTNSSALGQDKTFSAWAYLRINDESSECWQNEDIGDVAAAGSANQSNGTWTVKGSGSDIFENSDEFHFVYQSLSGDGQIIARVVSQEDTGDLAKAGVMIRKELEGNSEYAGIFVTPGYGVFFQSRTSEGGSTNYNWPAYSEQPPCWFKLTRSGNTFAGYVSSDGSTWTQVGSDVSISMGTDDVYIGMAVCSHDNGVLSTVVFDNVGFGEVTYETFTEAKVDSDATSITISTPGSGDAVAILGSWTSDLTHTAESGSNRALLFITHAEHNASVTLNSVTYGGQTMTQVIDQIVTSSGYCAYVAAYILDEAGITAATSDTFVPTWSTTPYDVSYASVFLSNVDQTTPVGASASNSTASAFPNPITTTALSTTDGDMVIDAATCGNAGDYTVNNGFTEALEHDMSSSTGTDGYKSATGADETPSVTHSNPNRQVIIGFVAQGAGPGETDTVSGGAGYISQSVSGDSGTSTFTLGSSNEAQMLTIAIAPDSNDDSGCVNQIRP